jgi:type II secretory pathway component PulK
MKYLRNQKGSALVVTLILMMVVTVLGSAMLFSIASEIKLNKAMEERTIARYLAQAGIDHGLLILENEANTLVYPYSKDVAFENSTRLYHINIVKIAPNIIITATGKLKIDGAIKQQVSIVATIQEDGKVLIQE